MVRWRLSAAGSRSKDDRIVCSSDWELTGGLTVSEKCIVSQVEMQKKEARALELSQGRTTLKGNACSADVLWMKGTMNQGKCPATEGEAVQEWAAPGHEGASGVRTTEFRTIIRV